MKCPECQATTPDGSRFCPHCGARIDRAVAQPPAAPPATEPAPRAEAPAPRRREPRRGPIIGFVFSVLACIVIAGACLLPWAQVGGVDLRGLDLSEGPTILTIALVAGGLAVYGVVSRRRWLRILIAVGAGGVLVLGSMRAIDIYRAAQSWGNDPLELFEPAFFAMLGGG